ncbi:hypothetical protein PN836_000745 [Ningiella sp. W23]|uniref:hypothetical protein n=1 Tax=Ningiella sp. W23 TaxID=3023715 RepID=UPI0037575A24
MESISSISQNVYLDNNAHSSKRAELGQQSPQNKKQDAVEQQQVIKLGSAQARSDAEAIYAKANSYSEASSKVQKNLQAYEAVEVSLKREAVSQLMGVDLYA